MVFVVPTVSHQHPHSSEQLHTIVTGMASCNIVIVMASHCVLMKIIAHK